MSERYKIGFTGTQDGMTEIQKERFFAIYSWYLRNFLDDLEFHQGQCIGADQEALEIVQNLGGVWTVSHPPIDKARTHSLVCDEIRPELPFIDRNHVIVDSVNSMIVAPRSRKEELRSGTWATVRYARKVLRPLEMVWPD
jgi:hypothetical protein